MAPPRKLQSIVSVKAEENLRELWGKDPVVAEIDQDVLRSLHEPMSVVDDLAAIVKWPHLPRVLRQYASGDPYYDTEELHQAIQDAIVRGPRQPEIAQEDLDTEIEAALTNAARGIPSPDLHDRVLELMHERDAHGIGWYPGMIPKIDLQLRSEPITAKPRKLGIWPPPLPEPSVVDRLAAQVDSAAAERVARVDAARARAQASADELRALFSDEEEVVPLDARGSVCSTRAILGRWTTPAAHLMHCFEVVGYYHPDTGISLQARAGVGWNNDDEEMATAEETAARPVTPVASRPPPSSGLRSREGRS